MLIQITLHDLLILLLCGLGIVAVSILISILWNVKKIVGTIRPLAEKNQAAIDSTLKSLPGIA